jgi:hypothetical protein
MLAVDDKLSEQLGCVKYDAVEEARVLGAFLGTLAQLLRARHTRRPLVLHWVRVVVQERVAEQSTHQEHGEGLVWRRPVVFVVCNMHMG